MKGIEMHGVEEGCRRKYQGHLKEDHKEKGLELEWKWRREKGFCYTRKQDYVYLEQYNH